MFKYNENYCGYGVFKRTKWVQKKCSCWRYNCKYCYLYLTSGFSLVSKKHSLKVYKKKDTSKIQPKKRKDLNSIILIKLK